MADLIKVAVDAMGGDNAPGEIVKGAVDAVKEDANVKVFLVGQEDKVKEELSKYNGYALILLRPLFEYLMLCNLVLLLSWHILLGIDDLGY